LRALNQASLVKRDATVSTDPKKPVLLRSVKREPAAASSDTPHEGIQFISLAERSCPYCNRAVSLAGADPLSTVVCPACSGKLMVPGRVGNFLLHDHLGEGEMGAIYRATDETLGREVAVKLVRGCHLDDPESFERLRSEARAAGKLNHPHVAQVYALNFSNGQPYLVMELVTGQDFAQKLEQEQRIDERTALHMALDVADGLSALNREGLVHGDIKPANIVLNREGNAKLVDFGLSGMTRIDRSGALVGTPYYIAPELLRGEKDTHRSDLYSLGVTLYHLLAGRLPHDGDNPNTVLKARLVKNPTPLAKFARHVSAPTQKLVMRLLELDPRRRYPDSDALAADLRTALARVEAPPPAPAEERAPARSFFDRYGELGRHASDPFWRWTAISAVSLGLALAIALPALVEKNAPALAAAWFGLEAAGGAPRPDPPRGKGPLPEPLFSAAEASAAGQRPASADGERFTVEAPLSWKSVNLGDATLGGSTMQMGDMLIIQGTGTEMWHGLDSGRFVYAKAAGNYAFSAQVKAIARNDDLSVSGLMVKGDQPDRGPSLLFGFLGNRELFVQLRDPDRRLFMVITRSRKPVDLPCRLKLVRSGNRFEACHSVEGQVWETLARCELVLPAETHVGFALSAQLPNSLATAKFADIHLAKPERVPLSDRK